MDIRLNFQDNLHHQHLIHLYCYFRWEFTIMQQNVSVTVNGTPYANTIEVKQELKIQLAVIWVPATYWDYQIYLCKR